MTSPCSALNTRDLLLFDQRPAERYFISSPEKDMACLHFISKSGKRHDLPAFYKQFSEKKPEIIIPKNIVCKNTGGAWKISALPVFSFQSVSIAGNPPVSSAAGSTPVRHAEEGSEASGHGSGTAPARALWSE